MKIQRLLEAEANEIGSGRNMPEIFPHVDLGSPIGHIGTLDIYCTRKLNNYYVWVYDGRKKVGWVGMRSKEASFQIFTANVINEYKGRNIMPSVYKYLILEQNISLMSDTSLSWNAIKMWLRMMYDKRIVVFGFNPHFDETMRQLGYEEYTLIDASDPDEALQDMIEENPSPEELTEQTYTVFVAQKKGLLQPNTLMPLSNK